MSHTAYSNQWRALWLATIAGDKNRLERRTEENVEIYLVIMPKRSATVGDVANKKKKRTNDSLETFQYTKKSVPTLGSRTQKFFLRHNNQLTTDKPSMTVVTKADWAHVKKAIDPISSLRPHCVFCRQITHRYTKTRNFFILTSHTATTISRAPVLLGKAPISMETGSWDRDA